MRASLILGRSGRPGLFAGTVECCMVHDPLARGDPHRRPGAAHGRRRQGRARGRRPAHPRAPARDPARHRHRRLRRRPHPPASRPASASSPTASPAPARSAASTPPSSNPRARGRSCSAATCRSSAGALLERLAPRTPTSSSRARPRLRAAVRHLCEVVRREFANGSSMGICRRRCRRPACASSSSARTCWQRSTRRVGVHQRQHPDDDHLAGQESRGSYHEEEGVKVKLKYSAS
jgi:hypothetical protein